MADQEIEIKEAAPGAGPGLSLGDLFRYGDLIEKVIGVFTGAVGLTIGTLKKLPVLKVKFGGRRYEWDMGELKRTG